MSEYGIDCPKCSKGEKKIPTERKLVPAGTGLQVTGVFMFQLNHTSQIDYCARCRGWYPVELRGVRL